MTWHYRPGQDPAEQLNSMEKELGIQNITDMNFDESTGYLTIFTDTKRFRVLLTEF